MIIIFLPDSKGSGIKPGTVQIRQRGPWRTVEQVELATLEWVWWWNHQRLHGELGMRTPAEVEDAYYADLGSASPATAGQGNR
ncbi:transposase [Microbacterium sp. MEC084]|nr:transposase [Microbacterium sp. MEC084]